MGNAAWGLTGPALRDALVHASTQEQKWAARRLELIREIDAQNVAHADGCTSITPWLKLGGCEWGGACRGEGVGLAPGAGARRGVATPPGF